MAIEAGGLDAAVSRALVFRVWGLVSFPVTVWLIATRFTPVVQGYYYTFTSLQMTQGVLELGFNVVLVQFISHEWAHLSRTEKGFLVGEPDVLSRLASVARIGLMWHFILAPVFFVLLLVGGYWWLDLANAPGYYAVAWLLCCATVALNLLLMPLRTYLEGTNRVAEVQRLSIPVAVVSSVVGWSAILSGAGLYTVALVGATSFVVSVIALLPTMREYLQVMCLRKDAFQVSWKREFWPLQWRIGLSWLSGFFMYQSFVPILFRMCGPVVAGQMGATLQVYNAVNSLSQSWLQAVAPQFGILGARGDVQNLRCLVRKTLLRCISAAVFFGGGALGVIAALHVLGYPQANRFAGLPAVGILLATLVCIQVSNVETLAVRFQKKEPFVLYNLVSAALVSASNLALSPRYEILGISVGFAAIMLFFTIPTTHMLYARLVRS